jgi:hypothetical protein
MFAFTVFLLLVTPSVAEPHKENVHGRKLWQDAFWKTTSIAKDLFGRAQRVWNYIGVAKTFPKLKDALEDVVDAAGEVWNDLHRGMTQFIGHATSFWKSATEGVNDNKSALDNFRQILINVDQVLDCDVNTYEILMDVKGGADKGAFVAALKAVADAQFGGEQIKNLTIAEQEACEGDMAYHPVEVEFDISTDKSDFIENTFKPWLANWEPSQEESLTPFLTEQQPDAAVTTQVTFCEAYDAGVKEFHEASESIADLAEELKELYGLVEEIQRMVDAANGEESQTRNFFAKLFKRDPLDDKIQAKKAEKREAEKKQEHAMKTVMGVIDQCNNGTVRGPLSNKGDHQGEEVCPKTTRRLSVKNILV